MIKTGARRDPRHIGGYRTSVLSLPSQCVTVIAVTRRSVTPRAALCRLEGSLSVTTSSRLDRLTGQIPRSVM